MAEHQSKGILKRCFTVRRIVVLALIVAVLAPMSYWFAKEFGYIRGPRPMFFNSYGPTRAGYGWQWDGQFYDRDDCFAHVDAPLNIVVVLLPHSGGSGTGRFGTDQRMFDLTDGEFTVTSTMTDQMFLVRSSVDYEVLTIAPDTAASVLAALQQAEQDVWDHPTAQRIETLLPIIAGQIKGDENRSRFEQIVAEER